MAASPLEPLDSASLPPRVDVSDNSAALAAVQDVIDAGPYAATWESLRAYEPPLWYRDAKFGIFIHWGIPSVPAQGEWYSRTMYLEADGAFAHHRETYGPHDEFGYKDFIPSFTMESYDPAEWAELFRRSGAQFVVPVAEHHDGFAMYDTARSRWSATQMGPRRDVFGDLMTAVDDTWMVRGASSHRAEHWFFMNGGMRFDSDVRDARFSDFYGPAQREETAPNELFLEDWLLRTVEIIDRYRPQVLWFDWWLEQPAFEPYIRQLAAYYYNRGHEWGRGVVINYKWTAFAEGSAVYDIERGAMSGIRPDVWQNDTSVGKTSWGWIEDHEYKSLDDLVGELVDVVAKNGNLLLNIGPKADGTIAEPERALLEGIGDWLTVNGEAIFGSRPWLIPGEGPTEVVAGSMIDDGFAPYTSADVRFTTRTDVTGDYVYAIVLRWPEDGVATIRSWSRGSGLLGRRITELTVLGAGSVEWSQDVDALRVTLPEIAPSSVGVVVKVWLEPEQVPARKDFLHG